MKIPVDIETIKKDLERIGYVICDCVERQNQGTNWQIKFSNSGASVTIYDSNKANNTVVNGKLEPDEGPCLKAIVEGLKTKELVIDPLNEQIIHLVNSHKEDYFYDFKQQLPADLGEDLLHDILCLSNNIENREAYLIFGVNDDYQIVGIEGELVSNNLIDFLKTKSFAGEHLPDVEIKNLYYKHKKLVVIVCKSSKYIPFYLTEKYRGVFDHQIYTRVGDTNTAKNRHASYSDVERLWRIHFQRENE